MPPLFTGEVELGGIVLRNCGDGMPVDLTRLSGVHVLTLIRHRY